MYKYFNLFSSKPFFTEKFYYSDVSDFSKFSNYYIQDSRNLNSMFLILVLWSWAINVAVIASWTVELK